LCCLVGVNDDLRGRWLRLLELRGQPHISTRRQCGFVFNTCTLAIIQQELLGHNDATFQHSSQQRSIARLTWLFSEEGSCTNAGFTRRYAQPCETICRHIARPILEHAETTQRHRLPTTSQWHHFSFVPDPRFIPLPPLFMHNVSVVLELFGVISHDALVHCINFPGEGLRSVCVFGGAIVDRKVRSQGAIVDRKE